MVGGGFWCINEFSQAEARAVTINAVDNIIKSEMHNTCSVPESWSSKVNYTFLVQQSEVVSKKFLMLVLDFNWYKQSFKQYCAFFIIEQKELFYVNIIFNICEMGQFHVWFIAAKYAENRM